MRPRYRYVGYGTYFHEARGRSRIEGTFDPATLHDNELAVDVGGACWGHDGVDRPVLDHHFFRQAGQFPSAAAAVLHNAEKVAALGQKAEGDFWFVTHRDPDFDAFCAMYLARRLMDGAVPADGWPDFGLRPEGWLGGAGEVDWFGPKTDGWPSERRWPVLLASYAAFVDNCRRLKCPGNRSLHSVLYAAVHRRGGGYGAADGACGFFDEVARLLADAGPGALDPLADSVLEGSAEFAPELRLLDHEVEAYRRDLRRARKATVTLLDSTVPFGEWYTAVLNQSLLKKGGSIRPVHLQPPYQRRRQVDGLYLRDPECLLFKEWARGDAEGSASGEGFLFTAIAYSGRRAGSPVNSTEYFFALDPERAGGRHLYNVWSRLQAEEVRAPAGSPLEGRARPGFGGRADGSEGFFVDPWFDGSNYGGTIVATPNRGSLIGPPGTSPGLEDDPIAKLVRDELELPLVSDVTIHDRPATTGVEDRGERAHALAEAIARTDPPSPGCYRFGHVALAGGADPLRGEVALRVSHLLWTLLEGRDGPEPPGDFRDHHLVVDADGVGVWSRRGIVVAMKEPARARAEAMAADLAEWTAIARDAEALVHEPPVAHGLDDWADQMDARVRRGEALMRRLIRLKSGLVLPERRLQRLFFDALRLDEVVAMVRDANSVDVERVRAAEMARNTERIEEHIRSVAEVQSAFHWIEIFLISVYSVELFHILGESFGFGHVFVGASALTVAFAAPLVMLLGSRRGEEGVPGPMKVFFGGMAALLVLFLALGLGLKAFRGTAAGEGSEGEATGSAAHHEPAGKLGPAGPRSEAHPEGGETPGPAEANESRPPAKGPAPAESGPAGPAPSAKDRPEGGPAERVPRAGDSNPDRAEPRAGPGPFGSTPTRGPVLTPAADGRAFDSARRAGPT